ncbi:MAG: glycosyltransferase family 4 protein [Oscillospiraceae bacterium]|nr:glycosyltransferase family 4 protein [Oscillospiraceae bacterium]
MKKKVWIMNHYAVNQLLNRGGRHYWIAEQLQRDGYEPVIFGCNAKQDADEDFFPTADGPAPLWKVEHSPSGIPFVVIRSIHYKGNGVSRVANMALFSVNLIATAREYARITGAPDIVYASSVHPLTVFAGEQIARHFGVPCIGEVRDLWPETLVAYGSVKRDSAFGRLLYAGEKLMYSRADAMVFTMEGAPDYIREHGWDTDQGGPINLDRVYNVNNGVDLEAFDRNVTDFPFPDPDLDDPDSFCVVYTGAVRRANNLGLMLDALEYLRDLRNLKILIWGRGYEIDALTKKAAERGLSDRFVFKPFVNKQYIPSILSKADVCLMHWERSSVNDYGYDYNKLFEYLASGKVVFSTIQSGHSLLVSHDCGIETDGPTPKDFADGLRRIYNMSPEERADWGRRAREAAAFYDFRVQTRVLEQAIEAV